MIIKTKKNLQNCQIDINNGFLFVAIKQNLIFKIRLTEEQEKFIILQTKQNNNFDKIIELIDLPF